MDKDQAQFILESFRPDGADAVDADFAEALQLAAEDRELGEWLANERATDATFAAALCEVEIPEELRQHILAVMRGESPIDPEVDSAMDEVVCGAMSKVQPPSGLRDQIIAAMEIQLGQDDKVTAMSAQPSSRSSSKKAGWRFGWPKMAAIAAAVALGAFFAFQMTTHHEENSRISSHDVQVEAGRMLNASFELDVKNTSREKMNTWLVSHELPTPSSLPASIQRMKSLGCKKISLPDGKEAALICFMKDDGGMIHLVIVKNNDVTDRDLPSLNQVKGGDCYHCPKTKWNCTRWQDKQNTFILLSKSKPTQKNKLLQYF